MRDKYFTNLITIVTSSETPDHNVLKNTVSGPTSQTVQYDQTLVNACECLLPIVGQLKIQFAQFQLNKISKT